MEENESGLEIIEKKIKNYLLVFYKNRKENWQDYHEFLEVKSDDTFVDAIKRWHNYEVEHYYLDPKPFRFHFCNRIEIITKAGADKRLLFSKYFNFSAPRYFGEKITPADLKEGEKICHLLQGVSKMNIASAEYECEQDYSLGLKDDNLREYSLIRTMADVRYIEKEAILLSPFALG